MGTRQYRFSLLCQKCAGAHLSDDHDHVENALKMAKHNAEVEISRLRGLPELKTHLVSCKCRWCTIAHEEFPPSHIGGIHDEFFVNLDKLVTGSSSR